MHRGTILFVDDENSILNSIQRSLRHEEYKVLFANDTKAALEILQEQDSLQLVVSDYRMADMNGVEFLRIVKQQSPATIRVILSGQADVSMMADAINEGEVYRFLIKPWDNKKLKTTIEECLDHYGMDVIEY